jgi:hypothetical protein
MTRLLRWISRCLGVIQISLIISHHEDAKMVRLNLKFHSGETDDEALTRLAFSWKRAPKGGTGAAPQPADSRIVKSAGNEIGKT